MTETHPIITSQLRWFPVTRELVGDIADLQHQARKFSHGYYVKSHVTGKVHFFRPIADVRDGQLPVCSHSGHKGIITNKNGLIRHMTASLRLLDTDFDRDRFLVFYCDAADIILYIY